ncbi:MAG: DUF4878 domain-containing protein [Chloroflexi bacterium]|nr:DUF4878 domain-containing protein [Chloroflexota bacterium]
MRQDRGLLIILGLIASLIVVSLVLFFVRKDDQQAYQPENTSKDVVHNYVLALHQGDYQRAYSYLQDADEKPTFVQFQQNFFENSWALENSSAHIEPGDETGDEAFVAITITHNSSGPFEQPWYENGSAWLVKQDGKWKIAYAPSPYWGWDWYNKVRR